MKPVHTIVGVLLALLLWSPVQPAWATDVDGVILASNLSTADANSYNTASIIPTANACVILDVGSRISPSKAGGPNVPTATGNGLTFVQIYTRNNGATEATSVTSRITSFRAMGPSPSTGAITIDFGGETQTHAAWVVTEHLNVDTSGTHCSGALVQFKTNNSVAQGGATSPATVTLDNAPSSAENMTHSFLRVTANNVVTPGSGFTELFDAGDATDGARYQAQEKLNAQTADATFTDANWIIGAVEIKAASAAATCRGSLMLMGVGGC